ncbi:collagen alpha-1(XII) chain-like [Saccostrea echinata]|uniref:collagen alpha-1(XII) chain-like n=1 Tax=Saccostrea echinata TaxID=191078 RepID=UPI002A82AA7A|nr:collagen alpha-1(XII) chain-like [Saccostrea echinata]
MRAFVKKFLQAANIDCGEVRVGLMSYSTKVTVEFHLNTYNTKAELIDAIDKVQWRFGSTNTADGLKTMHEEMFSKANGDRPGVQNICVFMTGGISNIDDYKTIPEAEKAREKGIHIYVIGIFHKVFSEVIGIASHPASLNVFAVDSFDELEGLDTTIFESDISVLHGLMSYSTKVTVEFHLNTYNTKAELIDAIDKVPWRYGSTNTADGLKTMHEEMFSKANGDRPGVQNICIIMTDGVSNINYERTIPEAKKARQKGIHIYAIGIALKDLSEVNGIASQPACLNAFAVDSFDDLEDLDKKIFKSYCSGTYILFYFCIGVSLFIKITC